MDKALRGARPVVTMTPNKPGAMVPPGKMMPTRGIYHLSTSMMQVKLYNRCWHRALPWRS
ncbi:hypothetical protein U876_11395 [Aeromonas hydrophila NJ-35]|nr:hypothetical protein U876_11395 [Aeromonas hydrophila NJ-35]ALQ63437.1 hypothetical protein AS145_11295 [Aeromonas hydrophila]AXV30005.1 hypothetical protein BFW97_11100 [Aeromonas hydrophila]ODM36429.1 hypothetical protein A7J16_02050 [Aeromonas hydrophila]